MGPRLGEVDAEQRPHLFRKGHCVPRRGHAVGCRLENFGVRRSGAFAALHLDVLPHRVSLELQALRLDLLRLSLGLGELGELLTKLLDPDVAQHTLQGKHCLAVAPTALSIQLQEALLQVRSAGHLLQHTRGDVRLLLRSASALGEVLGGAVEGEF